MAKWKWSLITLAGIVHDYIGWCGPVVMVADYICDIYVEFCNFKNEYHLYQRMYIDLYIFSSRLQTKEINLTQVPMRGEIVK